MQLITQHERDEQYRQLLANLSPEVARLLRRPKRPKCGAKTRAGAACRALVCVRSNGSHATKCKNHGGRSTGATTPEGRAAIAESNRRRGRRGSGVPHTATTTLRQSNFRLNIHIGKGYRVIIEPTANIRKASIKMPPMQPPQPKSFTPLFYRDASKSAP
jgi:hypothetical protein